MNYNRRRAIADGDAADGVTYTLGDYCEISTCAGAIDWYRARWCAGKLFWSIILLVTLSGTTWQVYESFASYVNPSNYFQTVITVQPTLGGRSFPNVTVCNFNRINTTKMKLKGIEDVRALEYAFSALGVVYPVPLTQIINMPPFANLSVEYEAAWKSFVETFYDGVEPPIASILHELGHDCEATVMYSGFQGIIDSNACQYASEVLTNYGRCFTFDMSSKRQLFPGSNMGLQMFLNPAVYAYLNGSIISNFLEEGIIMSFDYIEESFVSDPVIVAPGTYVSISLSISEQIFQKAQYPVFELPCNSNTTNSILMGQYTKRMCNLECFLKIIYQHCGCIPPMNTKDNIRTCHVNETIACYEPMVAQMINSSYDYGATAEQCVKTCLDPCYGYTTVHKSVTTTRFPAENAKEKLGELFEALNAGSSARVFLDNIIAVDAYFPVMEVMTISTSEATPIFNFIGNIGGQLGMWNGMCVMTLVQAVYFLAARFWQMPTRETRVIKVDEEFMKRPVNSMYTRPYYVSRPTVFG